MKTDFVKVDNFYLSDEVLKNETPSRQSGIDAETETMQRIYGCEMIQTAGICLQFPQVVMATGQVLLQRFYCKRSLTQFDVKAVSLSCLWLAAKLEEVPKLESNMWKVLMVFDRVARRKEGKTLEPLELHSKKYYKMRDEVVRIERDLLIAFGFVLHVEHPHKQVMNYLTTLSRRKTGEEEAPSPEQEASLSRLMQTAFNYVNDSLRTTLCVRFKAETVACACIFLASRKLQVPMPESVGGSDFCWWELFDVSFQDMIEVCSTILNLYSLPKSCYTPLTASQKPPSAPPGPQHTPERIPRSPCRVDPFETPPTSLASGGVSQSATAKRGATPLNLGQASNTSAAKAAADNGAEPSAPRRTPAEGTPPNPRAAGSEPAEPGRGREDRIPAGNGAPRSHSQPRGRDSRSPPGREPGARRELSRDDPLYEADRAKDRDSAARRRGDHAVAERSKSAGNGVAHREDRERERERRRHESRSSGREKHREDRDRYADERPAESHPRPKDSRRGRPERKRPLSPDFNRKRDKHAHEAPHRSPKRVR
uniref:Arginine-rich cyclin 1 n=1 Tax=Tetraselmis sp. GSL018 TaxID=582737 RepID=A0A061R4S7_9CHLO|eukprot:CAMPEP_0177603504 /NCGR_PEP_ID=MMETSP0419_2-20121207/15553_1 /TAXON_ID=582737 /ORGANISM="Tetraselmis sp., Strain GSL018" /LENGTH=538 /DNA_ID=CAMNT_0019097291 /DNA_START=136 /DNA_END=1752 /DNA_ORIENTATION=+